MGLIGRRDGDPILLEGPGFLAPRIGGEVDAPVQQVEAPRLERPTHRRKVRDEVRRTLDEQGAQQHEGEIHGLCEAKVLHIGLHKGGRRLEYLRPVVGIRQHGAAHI